MLITGWFRLVESNVLCRCLSLEVRHLFGSRSAAMGRSKRPVGKSVKTSPSLIRGDLTNGNCSQESSGQEGREKARRQEGSQEGRQKAGEEGCQKRSVEIIDL